MQATLLVELLTEELPPKALRQLAERFCAALTAGLHTLFPHPHSVAPGYFATPRRLAVLIHGVHDRGTDGGGEASGPAVGAKAEAIAGFARKHGVTIDALERRPGPKGEIYVARYITKGAVLSDVLAEKVEDALKALPIPKVMRWGSGEAQFVRPVHGLVMMHGTKVVPGKVLGLDSSNLTRGHRFMGKSEIALANADEYEKRLLDEGMVLADFEKRKSEIYRQLRTEAKQLGASLGEHQGLLDEVTALVEHPSVYVGEFDKAFLGVPQECLILTMQQHQRYFPLFDAAGKLLPKFLIVSNMKVADPRHIIGGNQRVVRPRLEDARFFYNQDRKQRLEERIPLLAKVVYHNKLGSQLDRVRRVKLLAGKIARLLGANALLAERTAELAKADLLTGMVGEFPELQGTMGCYYALHDKESSVVAEAIEMHYRPRFAGDKIPEGPIARSVALADKLCTLVGMFAVGAAPTGEKDPFALRRQALGVLRIMIEAPISLELFQLVRSAEEVFPEGIIKNDPNELRDFLRDRLRNFLRERGEDALQVDAVVSQINGLMYQVLARLNAVKEFSKLPEAKDLAAANKRVLNIIYKNKEIRHRSVDPKRELLTDRAEIALMDAIERLAPIAKKHFEAGEFEESLRLLAKIKPDVDRFFDEVMVMVDDPKIRNNRAALLQQLGLLMNQVADISKLAA